MAWIIAIVAFILVGLLAAILLRFRHGTTRPADSTSRPSLEDSGVPEWAEFFMSAADFERFLAGISGYFEGKGQRVAVENGLVHPIGGTTGSWKYGLTSVGQQCAAAPTREWPRIIAAHFDAMKRSEAQDRELESEIGDFDAIRPRLVVRLWDRQVLENNPIEGVMREDIPGLLSVLCIDLPDSIKSVHREIAEKWGRDSDELFAAAEQNVREMCEVETEEVSLEDMTLKIVQGESPYVASLAIDLQRFPGLEGPHGAFVGIPIRHAIVALPWIEPKGFAKVHNLMRIVAGMEHDGPGSVSSRVYWYRKGEWTEIPFEIKDDGELAVRPPDTFMKYLEKVALSES